MQSTKQKQDIVEYTSKEIEVIKAKFLNVKNPTKDFQKSHLVEIKIIMNEMLEYWNKNGEFQDPKLFSTLSKNLITLTGLMRKQDEGIKLNADMNITHDEFRKIIDIEAQKLEDEGNQLIKEKNEKDNKRNNTSSRSKSNSRNTNN